MRLLASIWIVLLLMDVGTILFALQCRGYRDDEFGSARETHTYPSGRGDGKGEYSWPRLRYSAASSYGGYSYYRGRKWSRDHPKAGGQFLIALRHATQASLRRCWSTKLSPLRENVDQIAIKFVRKHRTKLG